MSDVPSFPIRRQQPGVLPPEYEALREQEVGRVRLPGGELAWLVMKPEQARFVLSDPRFSADKMLDDFPRLSPHGFLKLKYCAPFMINMDGAQHAEEKKSIIGDFSAKRVAELRPCLRTEAEKLIDAMLAQPARPVDLVRELAFPFAWRLQEVFLGISNDELDTMRQNLMDLLVRTPTEAEEKVVAARLHQHVAGVLAEKEEAPGNDLVSHLMEHHRATRGEVDRYVLASMLLGFAFGVHNSVATMISLGVLTLLKHPAERAVLLDQPDRMAVAVDEMLRYFSINDATPMRLALEDVYIGDTLIKAGDGVVIPTMPVNRDPDVCPFPNRLDLLREKPTKHLAFGFGPHRCAAQRLAPALLEVVYTALFERVPGLRLAVDEAELAYEYHSIQSFGPSELPVTW